MSPQLSDTVSHETASGGRTLRTTQIYEGTNQIQRMVIAKKLFR
jgi:alkylation response protein AidB-like acyl-CoA dehydrogenase